MSEPHLSPTHERAATIAGKKIYAHRSSIRLFIKDMWGLECQGVKPRYARDWAEAIAAVGPAWERAKERISPEWFGDYDEKRGEWVWHDFAKGKHYTWQQALILIGVEKAMRREAPAKISVVSGHGTGKSATCSWIILWFLYCFYDAQVPVTAPTASQMYDVLWKELAKWIRLIKDDDVRELYDWKTEYVRMVYAPESWFARARTSSKENTEALAGVHADHVALVVDEASGVPEQVFTTAQGALTSGHVLVVLISNGTRATGYFYDSHHRNAEDFQRAAFDSEESPIVDKGYVGDMEKQHGRESDEFKIRVSGGFPGEEAMDDGGYLKLVPENRIIVRVASLQDTPFVGRRILGVDPSGEGKDEATFVIRDRFKAACVARLATTNDKEIAERILTLMVEYELAPADIVVGMFGTGADVAKEVALASAADGGKAYSIYGVLEGNTPEKEERDHPEFFERHSDELVAPRNAPQQLEDLYLNVRALMYFRFRKWLIAGGQIVDRDENGDFKQQIVSQFYKRGLHTNRIQLMSKRERVKLRLKSPNISDAAALTFLRPIDDLADKRRKEARDRQDAEEANMSEDEKWSSV